MKYLLGILVAFIIMDGVLTQLLIDSGLAREANPILQPIVGDVGFIILKIVGALLCALILWDVYRHFPRVGIVSALVAVVGYGGIVAWNSSIFLVV
jgi:hypothetical protein